MATAGDQQAVRCRPQACGYRAPNRACSQLRGGDRNGPNSRIAEQPRTRQDQRTQTWPPDQALLISPLAASGLDRAAGQPAWRPLHQASQVTDRFSKDEAPSLADGLGLGGGLVACGLVQLAVAVLIAILD